MNFILLFISFIVLRIFIQVLGRVLQVLHHCIHWIDPLFSGAYSVICRVFDYVACLVTLAVSDGVHAVTSQVQRLTSPHRHLSQELHCSFTECHSNINFSSQEYILCSYHVF